MRKLSFRAGLLIAVLVSLPEFVPAGDDIAAAYERAATIHGRAAKPFVGGRPEIDWPAEGSRLRVTKTLPDGRRQSLLIDRDTGKPVEPGTGSTTRPAAAGEGAPVPVPKGAPKARAEASGKPAAKDTREAATKKGARPRRRAGNPRGEGFARSEAMSPDHKRVALIKEHDVWLREGSSVRRLSTDGTAEEPYDGRFFWSPEGTHLVAHRTRKGGERKVTLVDSSPRDQLQPRTKTLDYLKPGDPIPLTRPMLFDVVAGKPIPVANELFANPWSISHERWDPDGGRFTFLYNQRGHTAMRLIAIDVAGGKPSVLMEEPIATFFDYAHKQFLSWLPDGDFVWMSERDGWNHLWRFDGVTGKPRHQVTRGPWVIRRVERFDAAAGTAVLEVGGINPGEDPYHAHFLRIRLDRTNLVEPPGRADAASAASASSGSGAEVAAIRLTEGDGDHELRWAPDGRHLIDTWSRVDAAPVTVLRDALTGRALAELDRGSLEALKPAGIPLPERFVAKGRDGRTDIHGVIIRPSTFDPAWKYPVIEHIYAGPQGHFTPKRFLASHGTMSELAELGFIVVQCDGMGTSGRSKAFHDVCWKNLGDSGLPDRIAWLQAAAATRPWMDLSRVGIYGGSAGGQSSTRALLAHGDFYKVAVSDCGCHDNRMDKIWWNELWMSWPIGPHYAEQSNVTQAAKLRGRLLLVVGELDDNVDPASTLQVAAALVRAHRDFELLVIPGAGHGACESPYGRRKRMDWFVRHLLGITPPPWS